MENVVMQPVEFVALINQTLEFAYPHVVVEGEIANFRISKNRWVYFDLKDDEASVKCFGTVYQLPGPLEEGMLIKVSGNPRLHTHFGFSLNVQSMQPSGEGSIKKAAALLEAKLQKEGLFEPSRKRSLSYPPQKIGLIASGESAAYSDFIKVLNARWGGIEILHKDVQVQGEQAVQQIVQAVEFFNTHSDYDVDLLIITRGGGSPDDLAAFSSEQVTRAVAGSRTPTMVAIGHERDISLAELAADMRASTPSNAAELLVPDRNDERKKLNNIKAQLTYILEARIINAKKEVQDAQLQLTEGVEEVIASQEQALTHQSALLKAYSPREVLKRGFAVARKEGKVLKNTKGLSIGEKVSVQLADGEFSSEVKGV